jgi:hypothetical protein
MRRIKLIMATFAFVPLLAIQPGHAVEGPWCAYEAIGSGAYSRRCDLPSYEACRAWIRSMPGTSCTQNPYYVPAERGKAQRQRR